MRDGTEWRVPAAAAAAAAAPRVKPRRAESLSPCG
jgi:hypothetical protein